MTEERRRSLAYILRLWAVGAAPGDCVAWRAALEDPRSGKRLGFASLEQLFVFLMEATRDGGPDGAASAPPAKSDDDADRG